MNAAPTPIKRPSPKDVVLPVTRLVTTLSMTVQNGQLVAVPLVLAAAS
ncbi:MAG: hypothetical protein JNK82_32605 [Myxococcaceae bacterium]|nr:hypothetical protein [Myxococcaceae bacterium]